MGALGDIKIQVRGDVGNFPVSLHRALRFPTFMTLMLALVVCCCTSVFSKFWDVTWVSSVAVRQQS